MTLERKRWALDLLGDALRLKDAEQRGATPLAWHQLADSERTKWTDLAEVARFNSLFLARVPDGTDEECWQWAGATDSNGYGRFSWRGTRYSSHRVAYELLVGPVPEGLELDHLCRNRACVNPAHLEPVTHRENMLRGEKAQRTHCIHGHPFDEENTYIRQGGQRDCRTCITERNRTAWLREKARREAAKDAE